MRIGKNPAKESISLEARYYHRVIVPVYIPNLEGYFADAENILNLCLGSLLHTLHPKACISVVNNGCCEPIANLLNRYYREGKIDQLVHFQENIGKIDAIYSVAKGCYEPLITITDSDVLFLAGWITEVEKSIQVFPEIGLISPCPIPALWNYKNSATLFSPLLKWKLKLRSCTSKEDLMKFTESISAPNFYDGKEALLEKQLTITRNDVTLIVGAGHFVATMRREVFKAAPDRPSLRKIVGNSEREYIDIPVDKIGLFRVGTSKVLAHHLGNSLETWMTDEFNSVLKTAPGKVQDWIPRSKRTLFSFIPYFIRNRMPMIFLIKPLRKLIFYFFGVARKIDFKP